MAKRPRRSFEELVSYRFAIGVIAAFFVASLAGWIAQELVPPDVPERLAFYESTWGRVATRFVTTLRLYDPFHAVWYRFVLALLAAVLVACLATRWRRIALRTWRAPLPNGAEELRKRRCSLDLSWRLLESGAAAGTDPLVRYGERYGRRESIPAGELAQRFAGVRDLLRARGYRVSEQAGEGFVRFSAVAGRLHSPGSALLHAGIVAITVGGLMGSVWGWRSMLFLKEGAGAPIPPDSAATLRVDDFEIVQGEGGTVRDYLSTVTILGPRGDTLAFGVIEVNRPFRFGGRSFHQSTYQLAVGEFARARVERREPGRTRGETIDLEPGRAGSFAGGGAAVTALRFLPDFRMGAQGAFSASAFAANPAIEVEVDGASGPERGWLFLRHPEFDHRFRDLEGLRFVGAEPVYYTGIEIGRNPGVPALFAGFAAATLGLALMYLVNPRVIKGIAGSESLLMAGIEYRWTSSFEREWGDIERSIRARFDRGGRTV